MPRMFRLICLEAFEGSVEYGIPRLTYPFGALSNNPDFANGRTLYQINVAQINQLNFTINANLRLNLKFEVSTQCIDYFDT